ncbi:MAG: acyl-CoA synthetase FdrA [Thermoanaerobacteraceae bacterium]|nr:acyl-CoA synthetase FdrA [Thermoanaerobacteraceae bacterium]
MKKVIVKKNTYYDSVTLMTVSKEAKKIEGVKEVLVGMATELNKGLARNIGLYTEEMDTLTPNDLFIAVDTDGDPAIVENSVEDLLTKKKEAVSSDFKPHTLDSALKMMPEANLALISVPGAYAADEARKAMENNLHVMLFSDNVSIKDEVELKRMAVEKGLLMMGPDCGTAIINGIPLAFANKVCRGDIGVVGASGTGTQEVTSIISRLGGGLSQVIGTGGRDLKSEVGGLMMIQGIDGLAADPDTRVIVLISKPPSGDVVGKVLSALKDAGKPAVVDFIGGDPKIIEDYGFTPAKSLEDAAYKAVLLSCGEKICDAPQFTMPSGEIDKLAAGEAEKMLPSQRHIKAFYTGGTLCDEAIHILQEYIGPLYSNVPLDASYALNDPNASLGNTAIDFGDDIFTAGRAHPMIDPSMRAERLARESEDESIAVVLLDFVLGHGSNMDPVGEMLDSIRLVKERANQRGGYVSIIASVCGTPEDPQGMDNQINKLREAGVVVMPTNAQAARLAGLIMRRKYDEQVK